MSALPWHLPQWQELLRTGGAFPPAVLLRGPRGVGKLAFARGLAGALLCEARPGTAGSCGRCYGCALLAAGNHPDYREVRPAALVAAETPDGTAASGEGAAAESADEEGAVGTRGTRLRSSREIRIDQVRALAELTGLSAHRGRCRVVLMHPAEAMNRAAANALLKTLEEPPPGVVLLLVADRAERLLPTVVSRCRQLPLGVPDAPTALAWLRERGCADAELRLALAGGAPLAALALDDPEYWNQRRLFVAALSAPRFDALAAAERLRDVEPARLLGWLQQWVYDLAVSQAGGRVRYHVDCEAVLARLAARTWPIATLRQLRALVRQQLTIDHPLNGRLLAERLLIEYAGLFDAGAPARRPVPEAA